MPPWPDVGDRAFIIKWYDAGAPDEVFLCEPDKRMFYQDDPRRIREVSYADPEALEVLEDADMAMIFLIEAADSFDVAGMIAPRAVREVKPCYIHTGKHHFSKHGPASAGWAYRTYDVSLHMQKDINVRAGIT